MQRTKILILAAMHERPLVSVLFALSAQAMIKANPQYDWRVVSLISDPESAAICREYGIEIINTVKAPLGTKLNTGFQLVLEEFDFDYLMQFGDDDVFSPDLVSAYAGPMEKRVPYFGVKQLYFLDSLSGLATKFVYAHPTNKLIGAGRMFLKDALINTGYQVEVQAMKAGNYCGVKYTPRQVLKLPRYQAEYLQAMRQVNVISGARIRLFRDEQRSGCDHQSETSMVINNYFPVVVETELPLITDVKSQVNIWKFDQFAHLGDPVPASAAMWFWPEEVRRYYEKLVVKLRNML